MPATPFVGQEARIVKETIYGTAPATVPNRFNSLSITYHPTYERSLFKPVGSRLSTVSQAVDAFTAFSAEGPASYTDILWILGSLFGAPTTSAAGTGYSHAFAYHGRTAVTPLSYTLHSGDSTRARQATGAVFNSLSLSINRDGELTMSADGLAKKTTYGVTGGSTPPWAASPTEILAVPIGPTMFDVWLDTTNWAGIGTTQIGTCFGVDLDFGEVWGRTKPVKSDGSTDNIVEQADQDKSIKYMLEATSANEAFITNLEAGSTLFGRIKATGANFDAGQPYTLQFDFAMLLEEVEEYGEIGGGVLGFGLNGRIARDLVSGNGLIVTVKNAIAAIT